MVVIRFQRIGTKKKPDHRIVVTDRLRAQSSRVIEVLGHYNPAVKPATFAVNEERLVYWMSLGAQVSEAVQRQLTRFRRIAVASAPRVSSRG